MRQEGLHRFRMSLEEVEEGHHPNVLHVAMQFRPVGRVGLLLKIGSVEILCPKWKSGVRIPRYPWLSTKFIVVPLLIAIFQLCFIAFLSTWFFIRIPMSHLLSPHPQPPCASMFVSYCQLSVLLMWEILKIGTI